MATGPAAAALGVARTQDRDVGHFRVMDLGGTSMMTVSGTV